MPYATLLTEEEIAGGLAGIPLWRREGDSIIRSIRCPSFPDAIALVNRVADQAEASNHHPDIDVRWRTVTFTLSTHASGGLTAKDIEMAAAIDRLAEHG
jgi:4a-hydroxytetrahydrobiopterin dehydratase